MKNEVLYKFKSFLLSQNFSAKLFCINDFINFSPPLSKKKVFECYRIMFFPKNLYELLGIRFFSKIPHYQIVTKNTIHLLMFWRSFSKICIDGPCRLVFTHTWLRKRTTSWRHHLAKVGLIFSLLSSVFFWKFLQ